MRLNDVDLLALQPLFMQCDPTTIALCRALQPIMRDAARETRSALIIPAVDTLTEAALDELADELHVIWYDYDAPIDIKRAVIKASDLVHMAMGTPGAIERVGVQFFGDALVEEWWEYDAEPYHFRVSTRNIAKGSRNAALFAKIINDVKNVRSVFDGVFLDARVGTVSINAAAVMQIAEFINMGMEVA